MVYLLFSGGSLLVCGWPCLYMMVAIALSHKVGMSSRLGGSESCSTSLACVWDCFVCCGSVAVIALVFDLERKFLAVFLRRVMRLSCLVSDFVIGGA
jgi:hypothetical protein